MNGLVNQQRDDEGLRELALFAGAGGGILGGHLLGWRTICAVEYNAYARSVLLARQNDGTLAPFPVWDDVRTFDGKPWRGLVDVVSGGFPCQAYSTAASGRNNADDLWPEMLRVVADVAPRYVFAENTSDDAILCACQDLESMGYKTKALSISASDLGADHIRKRHWLLAYPDNEGELLCGLNAEMAELYELSSSIWEGSPYKYGIPDGALHFMDRIKAIGNAQIPFMAATAWRLLKP